MCSPDASNFKGGLKLASKVAILKMTSKIGALEWPLKSDLKSGLKLRQSVAMFSVIPGNTFFVLPYKSELFHSEPVLFCATEVTSPEGQEPYPPPQAAGAFLCPGSA